MPLAATPYRASGLVLWRKADMGLDTTSLSDLKLWQLIHFKRRPSSRPDVQVRCSRSCGR
jgi:hypothetical protein